MISAMRIPQKRAVCSSVTNPPKNAAASHKLQVRLALGRRQALWGELFSNFPPPRKLPQGTQVTARTEPSAGRLAALGPATEVVVPASPPGGGHPEMYADPGDSGLRGQPLLDRADRWRPLPTTQAPIFHLVSSFFSTLFCGATFSSLSTERVLRPHLPGTELTRTRHKMHGLGKSFNDRKHTPNITEARRELPLYKSKARGPKLA